MGDLCYTSKSVWIIGGDDVIEERPKEQKFQKFYHSHIDNPVGITWRGFSYLSSTLIEDTVVGL